ncbi:MAG: HEAT repeat domain-containing protein [Planctomycetaceae bacterium]
MVKRRLLKWMTCCAALLPGGLPICGWADASRVALPGSGTGGGDTSDAAGPAVERLVRAAAVYDEQGMRESVMRLTRIGAECLPHLRPLFRHEDANVRWQSLITVGRIGAVDRSFLEPLIAATADKDADVRGEAVTVLAQLFPSSSQVLMVVLALECDDHPVVRVRAFAADWRLRKRRAAVAALVGLLGDRDWMAVQSAGRYLVCIGTPAIPELLQVMHKADLRRRTIAVRILGQLPDVPPVVVHSLAESARSNNRGLSAAATDALAHSGRRGWLVLERLAQSSQGALRAQAVRSAAFLTTPYPELLPLLNSGLRDHDPRVRLAAMATMRRLRIGDERSVRRLCQLLQDRLPDHRAAAVAALGGLGANARPALSQLRAMSRDDPVDYIRRHALKILDQVADNR